MAVALPLASNSSFHQWPLFLPNSLKQNKKILLCVPPPSKSHLWRVNSMLPSSIRIDPTLVTGEKMFNPGAEILRLCLVGNLNEAIRVMYESKSSSFDAHVYCSVLQLCAELRSLDDGRKVHSIVSSSGVQVDRDIGSKLVFMYVKCGDLSEGRKVFDELASKERTFLWNLLLTEYAKSGDNEEALSLFKQLRDAGGVPDSCTFSCILKCLSTLGCSREGEGVHGYLLKLGFDRHTVVVNALVALYCKSSKLGVAIQLFEEMPEKDVISWNSMIGGCLSNGCPEKSIDLFSEMLYLGFHVDLATLVRVLSACSGIGSLQVGRMIHGFALKTGYQKEIILQNSLINMYSKCWQLDGAIRVFDNMDKRCVVSWTSMASAYTEAGQLDEAIELFRQMEVEKLQQDPFFIVGVLHACACNGSLEDGKYIHNYISKNALEKKNLFISNALIDMYAKCGNMQEARKVFDETERKDIISWNSLIGGYSKNSMPNEALNLFFEMQTFLRPNSITISCTLPVVASLSSLERGREIHAQILRSGHLVDGYVANALIDMYAKCGALLLARLMFERMSKKDLITWTVMIAGYGMHGQGKSAIALFKKMKHEGTEADGACFAAILSACSHSGLVDEGWRLFNQMRNECKIEPKLEHYACMVNLLCRAGHLTKAYKFIESMPIEPDSTIWSALLSSCRIHRDVKLAERVIEQAVALEPENIGHYILLANTYAEVEKWEAVKKLSKRIGNGGLQSNRGCSWIEIRNKIHIFATDNKSHPQMRKIESFLEEMARQLRIEGSGSSKQYAVVNADNTEKEELLCGHSEKLAVAFGILNSSKGKPIRVTKNLRVCVDCHEAVKFISKKWMRNIILRDASRFHHFVEGRCSCRGYW